MPSDRDTLLSMGFDPVRVDWALRATTHRGLQPAMDHLLAHADEDVPPASPHSAGAVDTDASNAAKGGEDREGEGDDEDADADAALDVQAKSIKCTQCSKVFRNTALANFHAEKSGHDQFEESVEEIKPLNEEEKKRKLEELRAKMSEKRARKTEEEAKEAKANEAIRRKKGKDLGHIQADLKLKEALKEAEQKKRDKIEEARVKAAVKAQIEADKRERAAKAAREKALREGRAMPPSHEASPATPSSSTAVAAASTAVAGTTVAGRDFKETRLQIRMASGGTPYTTTLPSDATLREVAEFLAAQRLDVDVETVTLAQHFPRKTFSREDFVKTLRELGLTPSAVLIAA